MATEGMMAEGRDADLATLEKRLRNGPGTDSCEAFELVQEAADALAKLRADNASMADGMVALVSLHADELAKLRADRERLRAVLTATCNSLDNAGLPNAAKMLRHELRPSGPAPGPIDPPLGSNNVKHHYKPSRYGPCRECGYPASEMLMHYPRAALTPPSPEVR